MSLAHTPRSEPGLSQWLHCISVVVRKLLNVYEVVFRENYMAKSVRPRSICGPVSRRGLLRSLLEVFLHEACPSREPCPCRLCCGSAPDIRGRIQNEMLIRGFTEVNMFVPWTLP